MSLNQRILQVLNILSENLSRPHPDLVATTTVARQLNIELNDLLPVLRVMDSNELIQTDTDVKYSLITRKGLNFLKCYRLGNTHHQLS